MVTSSSEGVVVRRVEEEVEVSLRFGVEVEGWRGGMRDLPLSVKGLSVGLVVVVVVVDMSVASTPLP